MCCGMGEGKPSHMIEWWSYRSNICMCTTCIKAYVIIWYICIHLVCTYVYSKESARGAADVDADGLEHDLEEEARSLQFPRNLQLRQSPRS